MGEVSVDEEESDGGDGGVHVDVKGSCEGIPRNKMAPAQLRNVGASSSCEGNFEGAPVLVTTERIDDAEESVDAMVVDE